MPNRSLGQDIGRNIWTLASGLRNPRDRAGVLELIAMITYLLVVILKKPLGLDTSLHHILQVFSISQLERTPILRALKRDFADLETLAGSNSLTSRDLFPDIGRGAQARGEEAPNGVCELPPRGVAINWKTSERSRDRLTKEK